MKKTVAYMLFLLIICTFVIGCDNNADRFVIDTVTSKPNAEQSSPTPSYTAQEDLIYDGKTPIGYDELQKAKTLRIKNTVDFKFLENLNSLEEVHILEGYENTVYGDIIFFSRLNNLRIIDLSGAKLYGDITSLKGLVNLEYIDLSYADIASNNKIKGDVSALNNLLNLK